MAIIGHGIDMVHVPGFQNLLDDLMDCFSADELSDIHENGPNRISSLAGRFAAKEAVLKGLGTGLESEIDWTEIQIRTEQSGRPYVILEGKAKEIADSLGISSITISISHDGDYAIASAIADGST